MIRVIHCKKAVNFEYIGRPSVLGNPFVLKKGMKKGSTLPRYREWFYNQIDIGNKEFISELDRLHKLSLKGDLNLGCWCSPKPCHGDIIKEYLDNL